MIKIALIDDQEYGIEQVKNAIPANIEFEFLYFEKFEDIWKERFDIALIDFYLDKEGITWDSIVHKINAKIKIWFSSVSSKSEKIKNSGADYSCTKLNNSRNIELEDIFLLIFS